MGPPKGADSLRNAFLDGIYFTALFRSVSRSLVRLFIPAFLVSKGFSFVSMVIQYYALGFIAWMVFSALSAKLVLRFGVNLTFLLSCVPALLDLWLLFHVNTSTGYLAVAGVVHGIAESLFWTSYHVNFLDASTSPSRGRILSLVKILTKLGRALGPVTGGWLLHSSRTTALLALSSMLLIVSILPNLYQLILLGPVSRPTPTPGKKTDAVEALETGLLNAAKESKSERAVSCSRFTGGTDAYAIFGLVAHGVEKSYSSALWPYYCSVVFFETKMSTTGAYNSAILLVSIAVVYAMGKIVDSHRRNALTLAAVSTAVLWIVRMFASESYQIALIDVFYNYSQSLLSIAFFASVYDHAREEDQVSFILKQQVCISIGEMLGWLLPLVIDTTAVSPVVFVAASLAAAAQGMLVNTVETM